jgi:hypothetical protein
LAKPHRVYSLYTFSFQIYSIHPINIHTICGLKTSKRISLKQINFVLWAMSAIGWTSIKEKLV